MTTTDSDLLQRCLETVHQAATAEALVDATEALSSLCSTLVPGSADQAQAIDCLLELLRLNNPGAAVAAVDGLVACGSTAVQPILDNIDDHNYGARAWAVRALAGLRDPRGLEILERAAAQDIGPSVRRAAARGLGQLQLHGLSTSERQGVHQRMLSGLEVSCRDAEWVVRYASCVGLEGFLSQSPAVATVQRDQAYALLRSLSGSTSEDALVVRLRALQALERLSA